MDDLQVGALKEDSGGESTVALRRHFSIRLQFICGADIFELILGKVLSLFQVKETGAIKG